MENKVRCEGRVAYTTRVRGWHNFYSCSKNAVVTGPDGSHWCASHAKAHRVPYESPNKTKYYKVAYKYLTPVLSVRDPSKVLYDVGHEDTTYINSKSERGVRMSFPRFINKLFGRDCPVEIVRIEEQL